MERFVPSMSHTMPSSLKPKPAHVKRASTFNMPTYNESGLYYVSDNHYVPMFAPRTFVKRAPTPEVKKITTFPPPPPPQKPPDRPVAHQNQRPLPPTPETNKSTLDHNNVTLRRPPRPNVSHMPWFHNVDRKQAEELIQNKEDGTFLLRPTTQTQNVFTLTLWYNKRIYNISVRLRPDGKYALGTEKPKEQAFNTVEELVNNYQSEKLVLYSGGEKTGQTLLVTTVPKRELY